MRTVEFKLLGRIDVMAMHVGWSRPLLSYGDGHCWGWKRCIVLGPLVILAGLMTEAEIIADAERMAQ